MTEACIEVRNLAKFFSAVPWQKEWPRPALSSLGALWRERRIQVLEHVSFSISKGESVAIIGHNGSGKTTLLRILAGIYQPSSGSYDIRGLVHIMLKSLTGFHRDLRVVDNVYLYGTLHGIPRMVLKGAMEQILETAGLTYLRASIFRDLSSGQQQRLAFAVIMLLDMHIFIMDECMAPLDYSFFIEIDTHMKKLLSSGRTLVMTSHDHKLLQRYCQRAIWLDEGKVRRDGDINAVLQEYEAVRT